MEQQVKNHRRLQLAVLALGVHGTTEDLSEAIDAFGQVIADLIDTPCKLAIILGDELGVVEALQTENAQLKTMISLNGATIQ